MLEHTLDRIRGLVAPADTWIVTARDLKREAESLASGIPPAQVIGEPVGRNTAPAIGLAAWWIQDAPSDTVIVVLPSDHRVEPPSGFRDELKRAAQVSLERQAIVTFGIPPTRPETGYGYIESGDAIEPGSPFHRVAAFREKPDSRTASDYLAGGRHLWNAGMFVFPPRLMLEEIQTHEPRLSDLLARVPRRGDLSATAALEGYYRDAPSVSIDYAVMERSTRALVARAGFSWDDLGSWEALKTGESRDPAGNASRGPVLVHDCKNVIAFAEGGLVAGVGVEDLVIVHTRDVTLVCRRDRAQEVRAIVEQLKSRKDLDGYL